MKIPTFLILAFGAITGLSVQLSEDIPDGLFTADFSTGNLTNLEMLALYEPTEPADIDNETAPITRLALPISQISCNRFFNLNGADYEASLRILQGYCSSEPTVKTYGILGFKVRNSVAYMCNYGKPIECLSSELTTDMLTLDSWCNDHTLAGFVWHRGVQKTYGRSLLSQSICGNM
ncbi:hypothetical protein F4820DRAFT_463358 [Hypoxylon rubiginosum]|uniref:Uncharacterized protein n=1 Tax=Hypoxylon rubiginosum TaxID=110542 RepID=A0ACB9ZI24_9PEZI|nr:hypothetical protein F4820DRAFT_463358 [Hypoxylon rubiginosum]